VTIDAAIATDATAKTSVIVMSTASAIGECGIVTLSQIEAMALTLLIEPAVAAALARAFARPPLWCAAAAIVASTITHPILWAVYGDARALFGALTTPLLEAGVVVAETIVYRALATPRWREAALLSLLANAASWGAGELIYALA
jgi:hypothetical protein